MSVDFEKNGNSARRRSRSRRIRRYYSMAASVVVSIAVVVATWWLEPRYRATARLELDRRTFPVAAGESARSQVDVFLQVIHDTVAGELPRPNESGFAIVDVSSSVGGSADLLSVSAAFDLYAETGDAVTSERAVEALADGYAEALRDTVAAASVSASEIDSVRMDLAEAAVERQRVALMLAAFERDNAAVLPGLEEVREQAVAESRRERSAVEEQLRALEVRRSELDSSLAEMQRGASQFDRTGATPLTSAAFAAAQARWVALRGLHGDDYVLATELGSALAEAKAAANARLASVSVELEEVREGYERLQTSHPLDHPDVISLAHRVSALERLYDQTRITGLSDRDLRYVEGLARERRDIDFEIGSAREQLAEIEVRQGEQAQLVEQAPVVAERYLLLQTQFTDAQRHHESAEAHYAALQNELQEASSERPGDLLVASGIDVRRLTVSRPAIVAALLCSLCFPVFLVTLRLIERRHRTVSGAHMIAQLQGRPPLAVVPELGRG